MSFLKKVKIKAETKTPSPKKNPSKGILLITAGIEDQWDATEDELKELTSMFMEAWNDPEGAVVCVRNGITAEYIKLPTEDGL